MDFTAKIQSSRNELIWLVKAEDGGNPCWYYLQLEKTKLILFKARGRTDSLKLTDYGTILYSGWGDAPPEDIKQKIKDDFG